MLRRNDPKRGNRNIANQREGQGSKPQSAPYVPPKTYPLPKGVSETAAGRMCENFSLLFYRYVPQRDEKDKEDKAKKWKEILNGGNAPAEKQKEQITDFLMRQKTLANDLKKLFGAEGVKCWQGTTFSRLSIGFGDTGPLDTGLTLHRLYGIPYLPASAVKGACRAWGQRAANAEDVFKRIFGDQSASGEVYFYDAYPENNLFELDIINPHYGKYYESKGSVPPADYHSPIPILFLTVSPGVSFRFILACKDRALLDQAKEWLSSAMAQSGIGAKKSLGYGEISQEK